MKQLNILKALVLIFLFSCVFAPKNSEGQKRFTDPQSKWFIQVNAGLAVWKQNQQYGFKENGKFGTLSLEIGKKYKPLSMGAFMSNGLKSSFFNYTLNQRIYGIYGKYSINKFIPMLPHGIDPYIFAGSTIQQTSLTKYSVENLENETESVQNRTRAGYSFGGGLQVGSESIIIGFHYQFTPGTQLFEISENPQIQFNTGIHQAEIKIGIRLSTPDQNRSGCYSFNKRKGYLKF